MSDQLANASAFLDDMRDACPVKEFAPGEQLRIKGQHYRNMYLIMDGECSVDLHPRNRAVEPIVRGAGQPIGEIGFLRGLPATATVTACDQMKVLEIDDGTLECLEAEKPELVSSLLQRLSAITDDRTSFNLILPDDGKLDDSHHDVEILLCRNAEMLTAAQRLRYDIYCVELGRKSPSADEDKRIIADTLDEFTHCFIAVIQGEVIGTIRSNFVKEGSLGSLEELYGMRASPHYPGNCGICTKFIVKGAYRGGRTAMQLVSHATQFGLRHDMRECFIDCVPKLLHYYRAMGFKIAGETFLHPENGPSIPLKLDLLKHGKNLTREFGIKRMITFYLKAKALKLAQGLRG